MEPMQKKMGYWGREGSRGRERTDCADIALTKPPDQPVPEAEMSRNVSVIPIHQLHFILKPI